MNGEMEGGTHWPWGRARQAMGALPLCSRVSIQALVLLSISKHLAGRLVYCTQQGQGMALSESPLAKQPYPP